METAQLLYVKNLISRNKSQVQQHLVFFMLVENSGFDKQIDVFWAGEDGVWHTLLADYHSESANNKEYWQAQITLKLTDKKSLAGNIQFSVRYQISGEEYWDNNGGFNYLSEADSGVLVTSDNLIQNIDFDNQLSEKQTVIPINVAVAQSLNIKKTTIHWTSDNWATTHKASCSFQGDYWDNTLQSNARNPNQYGSQLWTGKIKFNNASKIQYALSCENDEQTIWENNGGHNFSLHAKQLKVLILNLHCYQEENQDDKFTLIAKTINELDIDIVCLQEVAEYWRDGEGDWPSNAAKIINDRLENLFYIHTDWSHLGFEKYREGVAILSRFPIANPEARYVSDSDDIYDIHARKVVKAQIDIPHFGLINVFSAHLSWMEDGFQRQFQRLHEWAKSRDTSDVKATLLCGDFNITAGTSGYELIVASNAYDDQFLAANHQGLFEKIFRVNDPHWQELLADDYRIDYVFMNKASELQVTSAEVVFTEQDYGRVSDHCGYLMTFKSKE